MVSTSVINVHTWITTHFPPPEGWKAEFISLADPKMTVYQRSGNLSTVDLAQGTEGPTPKTEDRLLNH